MTAGYTTAWGAVDVSGGPDCCSTYALPLVLLVSSVWCLAGPRGRWCWWVFPVSDTGVGERGTLCSGRLSWWLQGEDQVEMRITMRALVVVVLLVAGCSSNSGQTGEPTSAVAVAPAADSRSYLGSGVPGPNDGSLVTVFDYRSPTGNEATGQVVAGIDVQVCVGQLPEGTSQVTWAPWSLVGEDNARYSTPAPAGGGDMGPQFPQVARVASGDCVRGWITFEVPPDAKVSTVRYILGEDAGNFSAAFRPLPAPAPGQTRPEGCELISDPNDESASSIWLKPYQDVRIDVRGFYPSTEDHGTYYVARTTAGAVLIWFWFERLYFERLNGATAKNLPQPADAETYAVAVDFMDNGKAYRPSISAAFEFAKQCVS